MSRRDARWLSSLSHHISPNNRKVYKALQSFSCQGFKNNNLILWLPCQANKEPMNVRFSIDGWPVTCCPPNRRLFSCFKSNLKINQFHLHYTCTEGVTRNKSKGVSHGESIGTPRVSFIEFSHCTSNRQGKTHNYKCVSELRTTLCRVEQTGY